MLKKRKEVGFFSEFFLSSSVLLKKKKPKICLRFYLFYTSCAFVSQEREKQTNEIDDTEN
jgi:hypothetical protein